MTITPWVQTFSGAAFDLLAPRPEQVNLLDIAHHLSRLCRYNGATCGEYGWSVAQHSLLVEQLLQGDPSPNLRLHALLHDAHEAYVGDIPSPVKSALGIRFSTAWDGLTAGIDAVIWRVFGLESPTAEEREIIIKADTAALYPERDRLMAIPPRDWGLPKCKPIEPPCDLAPMSSDRTKAAFIARVRRVIDLRYGLASTPAAAPEEPLRASAGPVIRVGRNEHVELPGKIENY